MDVDSPRFDIDIVAPHRFEQLLARETRPGNRGIKDILAAKT